MELEGDPSNVPVPAWRDAVGWEVSAGTDGHKRS